MTFDVSTLTFAGGVVAFASGLILLMVWMQDRNAWAALCWAVASCGMGVGIAMLALHGVLPYYASDIVGPLILDVGAALVWVAARIFNKGLIRPRVVIAAIGAWIAALMLTGAFAHEQLSMTLGVGISGCLYAAAAFEFWRGSGEPLRGRRPMIWLLLLEATALFLAAIDFSSSKHALPTPSVGWFGIIHFVGLVYAGGSAIFLVMMLKERSEAGHKAAALVDPLTGLSNRRAFMDRAQRMFDRGKHDETPISLLVFDLDRFKGVNDTFGHLAGDHVLRTFSDVLSRSLRPTDVAGRMGGDEFALALPGSGIQIALPIARRIRDAFQSEARFLNGERIDATVSIGVATDLSGSSLVDAIASADRALYQAKGLGRNRVMIAEGDSNPSNVFRIA
jgi:diguanylate cyclase (GGDEF)-like protein